MHEGNTFGYDPVLTMDRSESLANLLLLDNAFLQSDPNLQEMAVTTTDITTAPFTPTQNHNDLANNSLPSTSGRVNETSNVLCDFKANDTPFLCSINKGEVEDKIKQFSDDPVQPPATITIPLQLESASPVSVLNDNLLNENRKKCRSMLSIDKNTCPISGNDLFDIYSDPNLNSDGDVKKPPMYDASVPSTSGSCVSTPQKTKTDRPVDPNKNAIAARANRMKKKCYVADLEKTVESLQKENQDLTQRLKSVTSENEKRGSEIEYLKSVLINGNKFMGILKNVPSIKSVGFPLKSAETGPCVGGMSPLKSKATPGTSYCSKCKNNNTNISENPPLPSSSFSLPTSSLQLRNTNIIKESPVGGGGVPDKKWPQNKDPLLRGLSFNNCQIDNKEQLGGLSKDLRKTQSGRVTKNENQKCLSTWGAKGKKKGAKNKSTDPTS